MNPNDAFRPWRIRNSASAALVAFSLASAIAQAQPGGPALVVVATAVEREVAAGQSFVGTVMPTQRSVVGSPVDGRVLDFPVNEGDWVTKDQTVAQLRTRTLECELAAAQAELQFRQFELAELQNGSRPEEIESAKAALARTEALKQFARARATRTETLFRRGSGTSQEELDEVMSAAAATEQSHLEAKATYEMVAKGPRPEKIQQAQARVDIQQAIVDQLDDILARHTIKAPFDGYVVAEHTEVGAWLKRGDPVVEIVALDPVEIRVSVPENHIGNLQPDMPATIRLDALPEELIPATVTRVVPQADMRSRTFPVLVNLPNPRRGKSHLLKSGMIARVTLAVGKLQPAVLVPKDALVLGGPQPLVYVVVQDPKIKQTVAQPVAVELGVAEDSLIQISGAVKAGQQVVVQGNERLMPGAAVRVQAAAP